MTDLSVIIPSYNTKEITKRCLTALNNNLTKEKNLAYEILVVDNGSTDGSQSQISKLKSQNDISNLKIILNKTNLGFTKANNIGLKKSTGKYVLFLNSDAMVEKVDFTNLIKYLDANVEIGVLTVRVLLPDGKIDPASHRGFPTIWNSICYFLQLEKIFGRLPFIGRYFGGYHLTYLDLNSIHQIDSPSGAFYLARREILEKLNGFDEDFFMYGEDLDLSFRIKNLGYKIVYYPAYSITHLKYSSGLKKETKEVKEQTRKHFFSAMKIFYQKHYEKVNFQPINKLVYFFIDLKNKFS